MDVGCHTSHSADRKRYGKFQARVRVLLIHTTCRKSKGSESYGGYVTKGGDENCHDGKQGEGPYSTYYNERSQSISLSNCYQSKRRRVGDADGHILMTEKMLVYEFRWWRFGWDT
jgi:hypothetical protein